MSAASKVVSIAETLHDCHILNVSVAMHVIGEPTMCCRRSSMLRPWHILTLHIIHEGKGFCEK